MSKLIISENLFLEVNELKRMNKFVKESGYVPILKAIVKNPGIVQNSNNSYFKVSPNPNASESVIVNAGLAYTSELEGIELDINTTLAVPNTGVKQWIILSRATTHNEAGTVSINSDGSIVGINTKFLEVLRGQPNFPNKVQFSSTVNTSTYEVVSVTNDTNALIAGAVTPETGLKYSVVGTFTPGFVPLEANQNIYEYDSCMLRVLASETRPSLNTDEFLIAMISYDAVANMNISDERIYYMFNNPYVQGGGGGNTVNAVNPICSLLSVKNTGLLNKGAEFEMLIESAYHITEYELIQSTLNNIFNIIQGSCNYLGAGSIPDGFFKGWLLLNRKNMKTAEIANNLNKELYIPVLDTSIIEESGNDFVIVPTFQNIEFQVKCSNNVDYPQWPTYYLESLSNSVNRIKFSLYYPKYENTFEENVTITLSYRMIDGTTRRYPFYPLAIASFNNINGISEILAESSYSINIQDVEPQEEMRNYS